MNRLAGCLQYLLRRTAMKKSLCMLFLIIPCLFLNPKNAESQDNSLVLAKDHSLHIHFLDFAFSRIHALNRHYLHTPENIFIESAGASFIARYHKVDPSSVSIEVKKTNSSQTPFVGILRYIESVYESNGGCRISVAQGPFNPVHHRRVTEIFRYVQNRWQ